MPDPRVEVVREVLRLRRQLLFLYAVIIAATLLTLQRVLGGTPAHPTHFLVAWFGVLAASLLAVLLGRRIHARMTALLARL